MERLTTLAVFLDAGRWPAGTRALRYSVGLARDHGFDAFHEPEPVSDTDLTLDLAHANVYSADNPSQRKKKAREPAEHPSTHVVAPT